MYDKNNVFYKIINKELQANIIYEDDSVLSFEDINKKAKTHVLVVPKKEFISYQDFISNSSTDEIAYFFKKINDIAVLLKIDTNYRLITNHGSLMGQIVFHFHVHLLSNDD